MKCSAGPAFSPISIFPSSYFSRIVMSFFKTFKMDSPSSIRLCSMMRMSFLKDIVDLLVLIPICPGNWDDRYREGNLFS